MVRYIDYNIQLGVNLGLTAIMLLPISALMCASFRLARRKKDPARVAFTYLKVMIPLALLWLTMDTISSALELVYQNRYVEYWTRDPIYRASLRTSLLGSLFFNLANTLLIMNLVELGNGFLFCLTESRTPLQRGMRYAGIASCIALFIIAIASFGCLNEDWTRYLEWLYNEFPPTGRKLKAAHDIILFAWAIVLLVFGVLVLWKVRHSYTLKNPAVLFLVATILNLISRLYGFIYVTIFFLADISWYSGDYTPFMFLDPIMNEWIYTVIVSLVFLIATRKHNGLWTTLQPWMDGQGPPALAARTGAKRTGRTHAIHNGRDEEFSRGW